MTDAEPPVESCDLHLPRVDQSAEDVMSHRLPSDCDGMCVDFSFLVFVLIIKEGTGEGNKERSCMSASPQQRNHIKWPVEKKLCCNIISGRPDTTTN